MRPFLPVLALAAALLVAGGSYADAKISRLADQLRNNDDYRIRTQAALALGTTGDDDAVAPLCDGLGDSNVSVRVASAAALGKLGKSSATGCLRGAASRESSDAVKAQIQKALTTIQGGGGSSGAPPIAAGAKYYVAIQVTNKTSRSASEIEGLVRGAMQAKLLGRAEFAVAPKGESPAQGGQIVHSRSLKGFFLLATVEAPVYAGGNLTQSVRLSMFTYPDKALQGEQTQKLTQTGTDKGDTESENLLMKMCVENAVQGFQKVAPSL